MTTPYISSSVTDINPANVNVIDSLLGDLRWASSTISYSFQPTITYSFGLQILNWVMAPNSMMVSRGTVPPNH